MKCVGDTHIGLIRQVNQDAFLILEKDNETLLLVCDGIGGGKAGDVAASLAVQTFEKEFAKKENIFNDEKQFIWIKDTIRLANDTIFNDACTSHHKKGMGTTLVGTLITKESTIIFHLGDSRLYAYYDEFVCLTQDHNYAYDLLREGEIDEDAIKKHPKRNQLTNALGIWSNYSVDINKIRNDYQYLLLCSDGLHGYVEEVKIVNQLLASIPIERKVSNLIEIANISGGFDNTTVILVDVKGGITHE